MKRARHSLLCLAAGFMLINFVGCLTPPPKPEPPISIVPCEKDKILAYKAARDIVGEAQEAIKKEQWVEAEQRLTAGRSACCGEETGRPCRLLLEFNLGYLMERRSRVESSRREEFLERSAAAYRRVLAEAPGHEATLNNLALVLSDLERVEELEDLFQQTRQTMPEQAAAIALLIGEFYSNSKRWQKAYEVYLQAVRLEPRNDTARRKIVEMYANLDKDRKGKFIDLLRGWEFNFADVAEEGYRTVVRYHTGDSQKLSEQAILRWVMVTSAHRTISSAKVKVDFAGLNDSPVQELTAYLEHLEQVESDLFRSADEVSQFIRNGGLDDRFVWWTATMERRHALGLAALAVGQTAVVEQRPEQAQRRWILGLRYAPEIEYYVAGPLREQTFVPLELITELAWLQFRYPDLDPGEKKFKLFIGLLFRGKAQAYDAGDLRSIQRHHTVLGEIFAAKGVWKSSWADNAIFQLSHAINTAKRREQQEGFYQPMTGQKARLADGYAAVGESDKALRIAVDAAQAYLDTDQLERAAEMLHRAHPPAALRAERNQISALHEILAGRKAIQERLAAVKGSHPRRPEPAEPGWLNLDRMPGLSDDFLRRQQFKANSDLAELSVREDRSVQARQRARTALAGAEQLSTLVGMSDLLRLERVAALMTAGGETRPQPKQIEVAFGPNRPAGMAHVWLLSLPTTQGPVYVALPRSTSNVDEITAPETGPWFVHFAYDSSELSIASRRQLNGLLGSIMYDADRRIHITGHSDTQGRSDYNLTLSERRAKSVVDYLLQNGVVPDRMAVKGVGEAELVVETPDETLEPRNRVVVILLE